MADQEIGADVEAVRRAAGELDGLAGELDRWREATAGLRLELGPPGWDAGWDEGGRPVPVPVRDDPVPAAEAVPGLDARRRRVAAELVDADDLRPHRFAAQESERALHALADVWSRRLGTRGPELHEVARSATATAESLASAGDGTTA